MLVGLTDIKTYQIVSKDGEIGRLIDVVFPRGEWMVRYVAAWSDSLDKRLVLPSSCLGQLDGERHLIRADVDRERVEASPDLDLTKRVERREEEQLYESYGWPPYWLQEEHDVTPTGALSGEAEETEPADEREFAGPQLQLATEVVGAYAVHSHEGEWGVLQDILVDDQTWTMPYLAVNAPAGEGSVLVETGRVGEVNWIAKEAYISLPAAVLAESPRYRPDERVTPELERSLHDYYEKLGEVT